MRKRPDGLIGFLWECGDLFFDKRGPRAAAAFAYFMTLTVFPLVICINTVVSAAGIEAEEMMLALQPFLPLDTIALVQDYVASIAGRQSAVLAAAALAAMISASSGAFRSIARTIEDIYEQRRYGGFLGFLAGFGYSIVFLLVIYLGIGIVLTGEWFIALLDQWFGIGAVIGNWSWLRFLLMTGIVFAMLAGVYRASAPRPKTSYEDVFLPGAATASVAVALISVPFSWFIGFSTKYSLIYGSLASVIIMMFWLYLMGNIVILGGVVNRVLLLRRARV